MNTMNVPDSNKPKTKRQKAEDFALLCVVTDPSGEWSRVSLIDELKDMGYTHNMASSAILTLKQKSYISAHRTNGKSETLFPTLKGTQEYISNNGWPEL